MFDFIVADGFYRFGVDDVDFFFEAPIGHDFLTANGREYSFIRVYPRFLCNNEFLG